MKIQNPEIRLKFMEKIGLLITDKSDIVYLIRAMVFETEAQIREILERELLNTPMAKNIAQEILDEINKQTFHV